MTRPPALPSCPAPRARFAALIAAFLLVAAAAAAPPSASPDDDAPLTRSTFVRLAERVRPAVATVEVWEFLPLPQPVGDITAEASGDAGPAPAPGDPAARPRRLPPSQPTEPATPAPGGFYRTQGGSGVLLSEDGVVVTSLHLVAGRRKAEDRLRVVLADGRAFDGDQIEVVGTDDFTDMAVLRLREAAGLPFLPWGDSEAARLGEWVMVVGNPLDFEFSISEGILSGKHRRVDSDTLVIEDLLQTTAVINAGNSGGALVDLDGRLLGVVTAIATTGTGWQGLGFAMPQHIAEPVVASLLELGYVRRGYLGVSMEEVAEVGLRATTGPSFDGIRLAEVVLGFPAAEAGLLPGDVLREVDGVPIGGTEDVLRTIATRVPGDRVTLTLERDGRRWDTSIELVERPDEERLVAALAATARARGDATDDLGPSGGDAPGAGADGGTLDDPPAGAPQRRGVLERAGIVAAPRLREERGLIVLRVDDGQPAALAGLRDGDILLEVDGAPVAGLTLLRERLADAERRGRANLRIDRQGHLLDLTLRFPRTATPR